MALAYRSDTVAAIYSLIADDATVSDAFPQRRLIKDDRTGRIRKLVFRNSGDFPYLLVSLGENDDGDLLGVNAFADEASGSIPGFVNRRAQLMLEFVYERETEVERDTLETAALAAIANAGQRLSPGIVGMKFRRRSGPADIEDPRGHITRRFASRITLEISYVLTDSQIT